MTRKVVIKEQILKRLESASATLIAMGVKRLGLFGSFVSGRQTDESDVDLLVEFMPSNHTFDNLMELSFFLEELLTRRVGLITIDSLSPHIGPHILKEVEFVEIAA